MTKKNHVNKKKSTFSPSDDDWFRMNKTLKKAISFYLPMSHKQIRNSLLEEHKAFYVIELLKC